MADKFRFGAIREYEGFFAFKFVKKYGLFPVDFVSKI